MKLSFEIKENGFADIFKKIFGWKSILLNFMLPACFLGVVYLSKKNEIALYLAGGLLILMWILGFFSEFSSYVYKVVFDENKIIFHKNYLNFKKSYEWEISETEIRLIIPYNSGRLQLRYTILFENPSKTDAPNEFTLYDRNWPHTDLYKIYTNLKKIKKEEIDKKQRKNLGLLEAEINFVSPF